MLWFTAWCTYRLPERSWWRVPVASLLLATLSGIVLFQAHLSDSLTPIGADRRIFGLVLISEAIPGMILFFYVLFRYERGKKQRQTEKFR